MKKKYKSGKFGLFLVSLWFGNLRMVDGPADNPPESQNGLKSAFLAKGRKCNQSQKKSPVTLKSKKEVLSMFQVYIYIRYHIF